MEIVKMKEIIVLNNDIYILECIQDLILVNDNYSGVMIYNHDFHFINYIKIREGLLIHSVFKHPFTKEVILYCPDNEFFIYLDIEKKSFKEINFLEGMSESGLSHASIWINEKEWLFKQGNKQYILNIENFFIRDVNAIDMLFLDSTFQEVTSDASRYIICESNPEELLYIDKMTNELCYVNMKGIEGDVLKIMQPLELELIHIIYIDRIFLGINESFIYLINNEVGVTELEKDTQNIFLRLKNQESFPGHFIILKSDKSNNYKNQLIKYVIKE